MADGRAFTAVLVSWLFAQAVKFVLARLKTGDFLKGRALKTGGMPSAHSALVSSLTVCAGAANGIGSIEFLLALALTVIVSYDALGIRAEFYRQGKLLKELAEKQFGEAHVAEKYPSLGDYQGHEASEVLAGLALGAVVSAIVINL